MRAAVSVGAGVLACAALGVFDHTWWPVAGGPPAWQGGRHLAAVLVTMGWYAAAAGFGAVVAMPNRRCEAFSPVIVGSWLGGLALLATGLLVATYFGLSSRWFWSAHVVLAVLLALVWIGAAGMDEPPPMVREPESSVVAERKQRITAGLRELASAVRRQGIAEAAAFVRATELLADEVHLLPRVAAGEGVALLLADVVEWIEAAGRTLTHQGTADHLQALAMEAALLRSRVAQWKRS